VLAALPLCLLMPLPLQLKRFLHESVLKREYGERLAVKL
jgi:hypothetical protein